MHSTPWVLLAIAVGESLAHEVGFLFAENAPQDTNTCTEGVTFKPAVMVNDTPPSLMYSTGQKLTVHVQAPPGRFDSLQPVTGHDACADSQMRWVGECHPFVHYGASNMP